MPSFEAILRALVVAEVRFVVAGWVAVVLHGHPRMTADLDLIVDLAPDQASRAIAVLEQLGLRPALPVDAAGFADSEQRQRWIDERGMTVFSLVAPDDPLHAVDLFARPPLPFEDLWRDGTPIDLGGTEVRVASIDHLIEMKRSANRPQDRADIAALEALRDG